MSAVPHRLRSNSFSALQSSRSQRRSRSSTAHSERLAASGRKEPADQKSTLFSRAFVNRFEQKKHDFVDKSQQSAVSEEERYVTTAQGEQRVVPPPTLNPSVFFKESFAEYEFVWDDARRASAGEMSTLEASLSSSPLRAPAENDSAVDALLTDRMDESAWDCAVAAVQRGISSALRNRMWLLFALTEDNVQLPPLAQLVQQALLDPFIYTELRRDISRISHGTPSLSDARLFCSVYQLMVAYYANNQHSEYTHSVNNMACIVVREVHSPDNWLPVLRHVLRTFVPFYTCGAMPGARADADLLEYYLRTRCPRLVEHLCSRFDISVPESEESSACTEFKQMLLHATTTFFSSAFAQIMPPASTAKLWDNALLRGPRVFFEFWIKVYIYAYRHRWTGRVHNWPEFHSSLAERLRDASTRHSFDRIFAEHLPGKQIESEEFRIRRSGALMAYITQKA